MDARLRAKITGGRIVFANEEAFLKTKSALEGKDVSVVISAWRKARSTPQNRYYHGVVIPLIAESTGYTNTETHEILKQMFFSKEVTIGKKTVLIATTTKENTVEWEEKMSMIRSWASGDLHIFIPEPNEVTL